MFDIRIDALAQGCITCTKPVQDSHYIVGAYAVANLRSFANQVELGIIGADTRNYWVHVECDNPELLKGDWTLHPDIRHCIRCGNALSKQDIVNPVFRVIDPDMVNPSDTTDKGLTLGDRVYFLHADCKNTSLERGHGILVVK